MTLDALVSQLTVQLQAPLPGADAHVRMAPRPRPGWKPGRFPNGTRAGAGLILFVPDGDAAQVVLTVRSKHLPTHRGQVSLPGGAVETGETIEEAALREANEEIGIESASVRVLGRLTALHIPASGYVLHPVIGVTAAQAELRPDPREVERILQVPLDHLVDSGSIQVESWNLRGQPCDVPVFRLQGQTVWGATAMILSELLCVLGAPPDPWRR